MRDNDCKTISNILAGAFLVHTLCHLLANFSVLYIVKDLKIYIIALLVIVYLFSAFFDNRVISRSLTKAIAFACCWGFVYLFAYAYSGYKTEGGSLVVLISGTLFFTFSKEVQEKCIHWFVIVFAFICLLSVTEYIISVLTGLKIVIAHVQRPVSFGFQYFEETLFNVCRVEGSFPRFQSLTEEPGLLGTLCGFMLFVTGRIEKFRFVFYVYFISTLLTFSLAGYVIASIYLLTIKYTNIKVVVGVILVGILVALSFGDFFQRLIYDRLQKDNALNRTSAAFDMQFYRALNLGQLWLGKGDLKRSSFLGGNAGWKVWIFRYGFFAFLLIFICYNYLFFSIKKKVTFYQMVFLMSFWLSFYQRSKICEPYSILPFVGMALLEKKRKDVDEEQSLTDNPDSRTDFL